MTPAVLQVLADTDEYVREQAEKGSAKRRPSSVSASPATDLAGLAGMKIR